MRRPEEDHRFIEEEQKARLAARGGLEGEGKKPLLKSGRFRLLVVVGVVILAAFIAGLAGWNPDDTKPASSDGVAVSTEVPDSVVQFISIGGRFSDLSGSISAILANLGNSPETLDATVIDELEGNFAQIEQLQSEVDSLQMPPDWEPVQYSFSLSMAHYVRLNSYVDDAVNFMLEDDQLAATVAWLNAGVELELVVQNFRIAMAQVAEIMLRISPP